MRKIDRRILLVVIIALTLTVLSGCKKKDIMGDYEYITSGIVRMNDDVYKINKIINQDTVVIVKNDKIHDTKYRVKFKKPTEMVELTDTEDQINLQDREQHIKYTWKASLDESTRYINYLSNNDYTKVFQANTEEFVEVYMEHKDKKMKDRYKRLIITEGNLIEIDLDKILYESIDDYII